MGKGKKVGKALLTIGGFFLGAGGVGQAFFGASSAVAGLYGAALASTLWSTFNPAKTATTQDYSRFDSMMNTPSADAMIPIIYGTRKWGGNQTWHKITDDKKGLTKDVVLCEGEIQGISDVRANDIGIVKITEDRLMLSIKNTKDSSATIMIGVELFSHSKTWVTIFNYNTSQEIRIIHRDLTVKQLLDKINSHDGWSATSNDPNANASDIPGRTATPCYNTVINLRNTVVIQEGLPGCSYEFHNGASFQSPPNNYDVVGGYKNCVWVRSTLTVSEKLTGANPTITSIIQGTKVLVWNSSTWVRAYSENPAYCLLDFITNKRYGLGRWITWDMVDLDSFRESAAYCDQLVTTKVPTTLATYDAVTAKITELQALAGLSESAQNNVNKEILRLQQSLINIQSNPVEYTLETTPRYTLNMIIDQKQGATDHLANILSNFAGFLVYTNNRIALRIERATPVSYNFNNSNIVKDSVKFNGIPSENRPNKYVIGFFDPDNNWTQVKVLVEDTVDQKQRGKVVKKELTLSGCTSQSQVLRLGNLYRDISKLCPNTITFQTTTFAMHLEPGDVVTVTQTAWINNVEQIFLDKIPVRILEITKKQGIWEIKAQQYNETIYNDALGAEIIVKDYVPIGSPLNDTVPSVKNLALSEYGWMNKDGTRVSSIDMTWDESQYQFLDQYIVSYSFDNVTWKTAGTTSNYFNLPSVKVGQRYYIGVQVKNSVGRLSGKTTSTIIVTGKDNVPQDVQKFSVSQAGGNIVATIEQSTEPDIAFYEIRMGYNWVNSVLVGQFNGSKYTFEAPQEGTLTFLCKAKDNFGNYSANAAETTVNIFGLPKKNIVYQKIEDITTWQSNGMYYTAYDTWKIKSNETIGDYGAFADIFDSNPTFVTNPTLLLPTLDLGPNIIEDGYFYIDAWGNIKIKSVETIGGLSTFADIFSTPVTPQPVKYVAETFVSVDVNYNKSSVTAVDIDYRVSIDGVNFGPWISSAVKQFFGRYVQIRLSPKSYDGITNVTISGCTEIIDVPDVEDNIKTMNIPAVKTHVTFNRKFYATPNSVAIFTSDLTGKTATNRMTNLTSSGFDLEILDKNDALIAGTMQSAIIRGY